MNNFKRWFNLVCCFLLSSHLQATWYHFKKYDLSDPAIQKILELDDYYELLGISSNATAQQIEKAFRSATRRKHGDKVCVSPEASDEKQKKLNKAVDVLRNARTEYDKKLDEKDYILGRATIGQVFRCWLRRRYVRRTLLLGVGIFLYYICVKIKKNKTEKTKRTVPDLQELYVLDLD